MAKKIKDMTTEELRQSLSIAGSPDKIITIMGNVLQMVLSQIDTTNPNELLNMKDAFERLGAEMNQYVKFLESKNNQQYL